MGAFALALYATPHNSGDIGNQTAFFLSIDFLLKNKLTTGEKIYCRFRTFIK